MLNLIQIYFCIYFAIGELDKDRDGAEGDYNMLLTTLFIQLALAIIYALYLFLNNDLRIIGMMMAVFVLEVFCFTWSQFGVYADDQPPLLIAWLRVNSYLILLKFFYLLLLNQMT